MSHGEERGVVEGDTGKAFCFLLILNIMYWEDFLT